MTNRLELVKDFHKKFNTPILPEPSLIDLKRATFRYDLMKEELEEYLEGVKKGDLENIAKELIDLMYALYGTVLEHGLQDKLDAFFEEVHHSHMSKDYSEFKMIKGPNYFKPDLKKILDKKN